MVRNAKQIKESAVQESDDTLRTSWSHVILGVIGAAISAFSIRIHYLAKAGQETGCGFSETISCDKVMGSKWGELFHIPLGYYGILYFAIVILMAIVSKSSKTTLKQFALQNFLVSAVGFGGSMALTYISIKLIKAECPVCMSIHATNLLLFIISSRAYVRALGLR